MLRLRARKNQGFADFSLGRNELLLASYCNIVIQALIVQIIGAQVGISDYRGKQKFTHTCLHLIVFLTIIRGCDCSHFFCRWHHHTVVRPVWRQMSRRIKAFDWRKALGKSIFSLCLCNDHRTKVHRSIKLTLGLWVGFRTEPRCSSRDRSVRGKPERGWGRLLCAPSGI